MKKYLIISHKFGEVRRGSFQKSKDFSDIYKNVDTKEDILINEFEDILRLGYDKYIFRTQVHNNYKCGFKSTKLLKLNHLVFTRVDNSYNFLNNATNGFSYYKRYNHRLPVFIPFIIPYNIDLMDNKICLGYYLRRKSLSHSFNMFMEFLDTLPYPVDLYTMGYKESIHHPNIISHTHTFNRDIFFKNISHYIYPKSSFDDPFPHSITEAVFSGKQIIIPEMKYRTFKDGIDDIQSCIKYHKSLTDKMFDNSDSILNKSFSNFYNKVLNNDFEYKCDPSKYKNFREWIELEV